SNRKDNYDEKSIEEKKTLPLPPDDDNLHYMQTEILFEHLCDKHDNCWEEVCWKSKNPEIELQGENLIHYSEIERGIFKKMIQDIIKKPKGQSLITKTRTCHNEAMNRTKLCFLDKKIDYPKSFVARHSMALLHNNLGELETWTQMRNSLGEIGSFSIQDLKNIEKICEQRDVKREEN
ncbi:1193_t:CDS:1, partial [Entrophospora sp. SA101]